MAVELISRYQKEHPHDIVEFMKVWYEFDTNRNGYLEVANGELSSFVKKYVNLSDAGKNFTDEQIKSEVQQVIDQFDTNKDGKIELSELQNLIEKEKNFLLQFQDGLKEEQFEEFFGHYDKDGNGIIEGPELIGLLKDMREAGQAEGDKPSLTTDLESYRDFIIDFADTDHDGKLRKSEIKMLFLG